MQGIANDAVVRLLARQAKARIVRWSVHDKRKSDGLAALATVVSAHPDIVIWVGPAALVDLIQDRCRVLLVEHRQPPHLPVGITWVRVVGELNVERPVVVQAILYLHTNLVIGQRRQEGKCSLRQVKSHSVHSFVSGRELADAIYRVPTNARSTNNSALVWHRAYRSRRS